ncbi:phosphoinositide 3-kinase regulatory subunit 5 isoform X1 [Chiloscyllium plagiosum]|uniref:phosphoinositide 3-kinase regulatory subunit 5 isoform X1 n=2 Tax=Chiloscyllium plagiosum TaxID=36176 RepID=UPI001CB7FDCB|nr:phosphoinositide 3-kinase regulatory subunit 5 isoform X1 [Chiloscyllium plagiosum]XP_043570523.1 phosphoinositide 3-kinase regulatory subunit 5 isoform X1 [Chiloscyllium plagiosum]
MQHTSCTEDRIHHALERCLHGLDRTVSSNWKTGLCVNRWSLEELVSRDPHSFLILIEKILLKTQEVQEMCQYDLLVPLALMFYSTTLRTPYFPPECNLLKNAYNIYHGLLTWPIPYCNICKDLLTFIQDEMKAPGISFQRLVRAEQGLTTKNLQNKTITVLLLNPAEVSSEFLSVAEKISNNKQSLGTSYITLVKHMYQAVFGAKYSLNDIQNALETKAADELLDIFSNCSDVMEIAATMEDPAKAKEYLVNKLEEIKERFGELPKTGQNAKLQTIPLPVASCYSYHWDKDNFDVLRDVLLKECEIPDMALLPLTDNNNDEEEFEKEGEEDAIENERDSVISTISVTSRDYMKSFVSNLSDCMDSGYIEDGDESSPETTSVSDQKEEKHSRVGKKLTEKISNFFRARNSLTNKADPRYCLNKSSTNLSKSSYILSSSSLPLRRAESLGCTEIKYKLPTKSRRSNSLPQHATFNHCFERHLQQSTCFKRRPYLSFEDECKAMTLRIVIFGTDKVLGKVARAYSRLRLQESKCPFLTKYFRMQFFYIPLQRDSLRSALQFTNLSPDNQQRPPTQLDFSSVETADKDNTNNIARYIGMLDSWYERNVLDLLTLPTTLLCQEPSKSENEPAERVQEKLSILGDLILYYCRNAAYPVLVQLYQAELTLAGGERRSEVFVYSLELGQSAATRAIKASGPGSKRLGIDGDREAVPLALQIAYCKATVSRRNQWSNVEKNCTSVNLSKACNKYDELEFNTEYLHLSMTEVVKRQNSKSKKGYNQQISVTKIKIDKVQIIGINNTTFAVCLDQDEQKVLQSVTRCEVSVCYKPENSLPQKLKKHTTFQMQQQLSKFYSLLCLPIITFSGAVP